MFPPGSVRVAAVPNAWVNDDLPELGRGTSFEQIISEMALAGYEGTELGSTYPSDAATLNAALAVRGLSPSGGWVSTWFASRGGAYEQTLEAFRAQIPFFTAIGLQDVYVAEVTGAVHQQPVPALANRPVLDDAQWDAMVRGLGEMGRIATEHGLRINYHHHTGTGVQSSEDIDRLMADTTPGETFLLLDTAHLLVGGGDPMEVLTKHEGRIGHVHLKNLRQPVLDRMHEQSLSFWDALRQGIFTVPGDDEGCIDFAPLLRKLADDGWSGWLVVEAEQDPATAHPLEVFRAARRHIADLAGL
ncbi:myo-inosose-2 dehydratase [Auraticoccus monumenti]|uniref:2-keto-myo-inositol dehydratase n=1 Tax=Auraticoccus monumenti TaxID=675864 RepID=A0A1G6VIM1_9ACTN|nr:myo-inosose-2 dehydratase [Auraticoccus monumenti]SDD53409.1 2-keto-myo-inositol dehydratase [Auraticoccus monumenti]